MLLIQQVFGGTVDRKVTEYLKWMFAEENILLVVDSVKDKYWPSGKWNEDLNVRTVQQIQELRNEAQSKIAQVLPEVLGGVVGKHNARRGADRIFSVLQNKRLNQHLIYLMLDEFTSALLMDTVER